MLFTNRKSGETEAKAGCRPSYIYSDDMWVYFLNRKDSNQTSIMKSRVTGGEETELIGPKSQPIPGTIRYVQIHDGYLYFSINNDGSTFTENYALTDKNVNTITGAFFRADLDGSEITQILEKPAFYPYFIGDRLYYQDYLDGKKLHVCDSDGTNDHIFIDDVCYQYIKDGEKFYYVSYDGDVEWDEKGLPVNAADLRRVLKIYVPESGTEVISEVNPTTFAFNGTQVVYTNYYDSKRMYSYHVETGKNEALYLEEYLWQFYWLDDTSIYSLNANKDFMMETTIVANIDGSEIKAIE